MAETLCLWCQIHEAVEDGFCGFQCESDYHNDVHMRNFWRDIRNGGKDVCSSADYYRSEGYNEDMVHEFIRQEVV